MHLTDQQSAHLKLNSQLPLVTGLQLQIFTTPNIHSVYKSVSALLLATLGHFTVFDQSSAETKD